MSVCYLPDNSTLSSHTLHSPHEHETPTYSHLCQHERSSNFICVFLLFRRKSCALVVCTSIYGQGRAWSLRLPGRVPPSGCSSFSIASVFPCWCAGGPYPQCRRFPKFAICLCCPEDLLFRMSCSFTRFQVHFPLLLYFPLCFIWRLY